MKHPDGSASFSRFYKPEDQDLPYLVPRLNSDVSAAKATHPEQAHFAASRSSRWSDQFQL
jgi:hypothetical protein